MTKEKCASGHTIVASQGGGHYCAVCGEKYRGQHDSATNGVAAWSKWENLGVGGGGGGGGGG